MGEKVAFVLKLVYFPAWRFGYGCICSAFKDPCVTAWAAQVECNKGDLWWLSFDFPKAGERLCEYGLEDSLAELQGMKKALFT